MVHPMVALPEMAKAISDNNILMDALLKLPFHEDHAHDESQCSNEQNRFVFNDSDEKHYHRFSFLLWLMVMSA